MVTQDIFENNFIIDFINEDTFEINLESINTIEIDLANGAYQVQSNYTQTDENAVDFIKNKPSIYTKEEIDNLLRSVTIELDGGNSSSVYI